MVKKAMCVQSYIEFIVKYYTELEQGELRPETRQQLLELL